MENENNQEETLNQEEASEEETSEDVETQEDEGGEDESGNSEELEKELETLRAENEALKAKNAEKNKAKYKAYSKKAKKAEKSDDTLDVSDVVRREIEKVDFFRENPDIDKNEILQVMEDKNFNSPKDASYYLEGKKMQDEAYKRSKEAGKGGISGTFDKGGSKPINPFAKGPKLYS